MRIAIALLTLAFSACAGAPDPASHEQRVALDALAPGVWLHTTYGLAPGVGPYPSNGLVIEAGDALVLIDSGWGEPQTEALLGRIETEIGKPVAAAVYTHAHDDRMGGAPVLEAAGVQTFASHATLEIAPGKTLSAEATAFDPGETPALLAEAGLTVFYPGVGHSKDNLVVYHAPSQTLFGGCLVRAGFARAMGNTADGDVATWDAAALAAGARFPDAQTIVPGHGAPGGRDLFQHTADLAGAAL